MKHISDRINLRCFCVEQAVKTASAFISGCSGIIATAQALEEYITEGIDLPDASSVPETVVEVVNNNCPCVKDDDFDEGDEWKHN